jgi:hypothetical protein
MAIVFNELSANILQDLHSSSSLPNMWWNPRGGGSATGTKNRVEALGLSHPFGEGVVCFKCVVVECHTLQKGKQERKKR